MNDTTPSGEDDSKIQQLNPQKDQFPISARQDDQLGDSSKALGEFPKLKPDMFTTIYERCGTEITTDSESPSGGFDRKGEFPKLKPDMFTTIYERCGTEITTDSESPSGGFDRKGEFPKLKPDMFTTIYERCGTEITTDSESPSGGFDRKGEFPKLKPDMFTTIYERCGTEITTDSESPSGGFDRKELILQQQSTFISEALSLEIGTFKEVEIRRIVQNMNEKLSRIVYIMRGLDTTITGSMREGLRLLSSDLDRMLWLPAHIVICDSSQESLYPKPPYTLILMDSEGTEPGHARLKLITPSVIPPVNSSCYLRNGEKYISTSLFRRNFLDIYRAQVPSNLHAMEHGPCASILCGYLKSDYAFSLQLHTWPIVISEWINRCLGKDWPPKDLIEESCHVVPTNSEPSESERDSEWRISFTKAEQKLVSSMNCCQFHCYILLRKFFNEVINVKFDDPCLSSYIIKTSMFWVIQDVHHLTWVPCNLLKWFWVCFKLLTFWVYKGECPNFFIPQNNMFRFKVVGHTQAVLFDQMYDLYCEGISCLSRCPAFAPVLEFGENVIMNNLFLTHVPCKTHCIEAIVKLDVSFFREIISSGEIDIRNKEEFIYTLDLLKNLNRKKLNAYERSCRKKFLSSLYINYAWFLVNLATKERSEEAKRQLHEQALSLLKSTYKIGCASDIIYLAMYYYKESKYEQSLSCLQQALRNVSEPYVIYNDHVDEMKYIRAMAMLSIEKRRRKAFVTDIFLRSAYIYLDELVLEQRANAEKCDGILRIPPLVVIHMLLVLTHHKLEDTRGSQQSVQDLYNLLLKEKIPYILREMSWHILGVCQQTCRDYVAAIESYETSLQQFSVHCIQEATEFRIEYCRQLMQNQSAFES